VPVVSNAKRPARSRLTRRGAPFLKWAWVDSNFRPHAHQAALVAPTGAGGRQMALGHWGLALAGARWRCLALTGLLPLVLPRVTLNSTTASPTPRERSNPSLSPKRPHSPLEGSAPGGHGSALERRRQSHGRGPRR